MVVTRFAPSPTGYLHIGGARTALFNWLFARRMGGKFILRIEDTDTKRNTPTAAQQVMDDLRWLGIEWDEGPDVGGPNAPYLQSERKDIYDKYIKQLLDAGKAYYCFDTPQQLQEMRNKAAAEKKGFIYRRPETLPDEKDAAKARAEGRPVTVRLSISQGEDIVVNDIVRGQVRFAAAEVGDFIIKKSDGFPTYHFAVVVDDELMGVTHVIRGQEHLMNTPGHQLLADALGFGRPAYAHMSVTISESGGKLSKRERPKTLRNAINSMKDIELSNLAKASGITVEEIESFLKNKSIPDMPCIDAIADYLGIVLPEINVIDFFKSGYLPEAMVNFIALLGWNPGDNREVMKVDELLSCFDISNLAKANSLFDRKKLIAFNTEHIKMTSEEVLLEHFKSYLREIGSVVCSGDDELLKKLIKINEGARTLADIEKKSRFLFVDNCQIEYNEKAVKKVLLKAGALENLAIIREHLAAMDEFNEKRIEQLLRGMAEEKGVGLGKVAQPLRVAICGNTVSPPIFDSVNMLGKENTLARIDVTLEKFNANSKT